MLNYQGPKGIIVVMINEYIIGNTSITPKGTVYESVEVMYSRGYFGA